MASGKTVAIWLWTLGVSSVIHEAGRAETAEAWLIFGLPFIVALALAWFRFFELLWLAREFAKTEIELK